MKIFGGLDIGTNGVRLIATDENLNILFKEEVKYKTRSPKEGWAEQDPDEIYKACLRLFKQLVAFFSKDEIYITFSSVMHSLLGVNKEGEPLTPLIIWADTRSREKRIFLEKEFSREIFYKHTACPLHSTYWPAKILWLKDAFKEKFYRFISIKEYVIHKLCERWMTDYSLASTSGLFNLKKKEYDQEILDIIGVNAEQLSPIFPPYENFQFQIQGKNITGFLGATDGVLANLGVGAIDSNSSVLTVGSSSAVRFISRHPIWDPKGRAWCYMLDEDFYVIGEATNGAGILLKWLTKLFAYQSVDELINENLDEFPYEGNEIICIPTLMAERGPNYNENLRGLFYGLSLNHSRQDIIRAVFESIGLFLKMIYEDVERVNGVKADLIIITGGLGLSDIFMQMIYYLIGEINYLPGHEQNTAVGAAMMGIKSVNNLKYEQVVTKLPGYLVKDIIINKAYKKYINEKYKRFVKIYVTLNHLQ